MTRFGISDGVWREALDQAREILRRRAEAPETISYSELAEQITAVRFQPEGQRFASFLGDLSAQEDEEGRGMISVLVVHKGGDMKPGKGFFELARQRGRSGDDEEIWTKEFRTVTDHWRGQKRR